MGSDVKAVLWGRGSWPICSSRRNPRREVEATNLRVRMGQSLKGRQGQAKTSGCYLVRNGEELGFGDLE